MKTQKYLHICLNIHMYVNILKKNKKVLISLQHKVQLVSHTGKSKQFMTQCVPYVFLQAK